MSATTDSATGHSPPIPCAQDASPAVAAHGAGDASTLPGADGGTASVCRVSPPETTPASAMAPGAFWRGWDNHTPAERAAACERLRLQRLSYQKIAARLGTTPGAVNGTLRRAGFAVPADLQNPAARERWEAKRQAMYAERMPRINRMRELVAQGLSITEAGAAVGFKQNAALDYAKIFNIKRETKPAPKPPQPKPAFVSRNPKLSVGQQQTVDKLKNNYWRINHPLPLPTEDEAARAIAEYLATRSVTRCPTMALAPINNGEGIAR